LLYNTQLVNCDLSWKFRGSHHGQWFLSQRMQRYNWVERPSVCAPSTNAARMCAILSYYILRTIA